MTKADQEQEELEKKMWEDEKEATAARLKKLNKDVEQNGKLLKEALDNMPSAGMKYWKSPESLHIATFGSGIFFLLSKLFSKYLNSFTYTLHVKPRVLVTESQEFRWDKKIFLLTINKKINYPLLAKKGIWTKFST